MMWLLSLFIFGRCAQANVIGIDFGSEAMKVALVQPGAPLEIVTNHFSKRKTETAVSFVRGERQFGSDAFGMLSRKPEQSYARLTSLLGRHEAHPAVEKAKRSFVLPARVRFNETRHALALGAHSESTKEYGGGWTEWTVEELVAMILSYAKKITRAYGGNVVRDCVIAVPSFATQAEREAMLQAAALADLRVLSLVDENTAAAIQFGLDRVYEEKKTVLFYNVGSESAQASLVEYSTFVEKQGKQNKTVGQLEVLGKGWSLAAGSFGIDMALTEVLAAEFEKQTGKTIRDIARPMAKIRATAKKTKEILSANTEHRVTIPSLYDDVDFQMLVSRAQLEEASADVFEALPEPIDMALTAANLTADDIDAVEIIGGGVRVPAVQAALRKHLSSLRSADKPALDLSVHLNGDEAIALGAAFHGANVSTSFRVRKVGMIDYTPFSVGVQIDSSQEDWQKHATLFKEGSKLGGKARTIAFQHDSDLRCELAYEQTPHGAPKTIAVYDISGVADFAKEMAKQNTSGLLPRPKVQLSFTLDASGLATLSKAEVTVLEEYNVTTPSAVSEGETKNETTADANSSATETAANATANTTTLKKKTHKRTLSVTKTKTTLGRLETSVETDVAEASDRLSTIEAAENFRIARAEEKNALETMIYSTRNSLEDREEEVKTASTEAQREEIRSECASLEDWLYDEADSVEISVIAEKRNKLSGLWTSITNRIDEASKRPAAVKAARDALDLAKKNATEVWPTSKPWLTVQELDDLVAKVDKVSTWLDGVVKEQDKKKSHEDPAFLVADIIPKLRPVASSAAKLALKPKPAPPPPPENTKNDTNDTAANATDSTPQEEAAKEEEETTQPPLDEL